MSRTSKKILIAISFLPLIVLLCVPFINRNPEPAATPCEANVVFRPPGRFRSPNRKLHVLYEIHPDRTTTNELRHESGSGSSLPANWDLTQPILCWDSQSRLWYYDPISNSQHCTRYEITESVNDATTCHELGGWDGVPQAFLDQLPEMALKTYHQAQEHQAAKTPE